MNTNIDLDYCTFERAKTVISLITRTRYNEKPNRTPIFQEAIEAIDARIGGCGYEVVKRAYDKDLQFIGTELRAYAVVKDSKSGFPQIVYTDIVGNTVCLSPFRGYSFQVSGNLKGDGAYGATPVVGLNNILDAEYGTTKGIGYQSNIRRDEMGRAVLLMMAEYALRQHEGTRYGRVVVPTFEMFGEGMMNTFIDLCIEWLQK